MAYNPISYASEPETIVIRDENGNIAAENIGSSEGELVAINNRIDMIEKQLEAIKLASAESVSADDDLSSKTDSDLIISAGEEPVSGPKEIKGKNVKIKSFNADSSNVALTATEDVTIESFNAIGDVPKKTANYQLKVNTPGAVKITASDFNQTGYNVIEIGHEVPPKSVYIDGINFEAPLLNNAISFLGWDEDAVITVSNCYFKEISNPIRLTNRYNKPATFNFINCVCDKWEPELEYTGFICLQDSTSGSAEAELEANMFAPDKVTINIINCTGPNGKILFDNVKSVASTGDETQILYLYTSAEGVIVPYDPTRYPTITCK